MNVSALGSPRVRAIVCLLWKEVKHSEHLLFVGFVGVFSRNRDVIDDIVGVKELASATNWFLLRADVDHFLTKCTRLNT